MPRLVAWNIVRYGGPAPLRSVDRFAAQGGLDDRDRALVRRIVGTELRLRATLRAIVDRYARGKPSADVRAHLRLGVVQLLFLDAVPPHAAVSETVRAAADTVGLARGRYVNGVLREIQRHAKHGSIGLPRQDIFGRPWFFDEPVFRDPEQHPFLWAEDALSMPASLVKRWAARIGQERAFDLAKLAMAEAPVSVRATGQPLETLQAEFAELGIDSAPGATAGHLRLAASDIAALTASAPFQEGRCTIQGDTAGAAVQLLAPAAGETVLDLCAAPGGKTLAIAGSGANVVALDVNARRIARTRDAIERLKPQGTIRLAAMDSTAGLHPGARFDAALLDAPCSNTGVLAQRPAARWRYGPSSLRELRDIQAHLLEACAERVRPGGRLVYSTCSLEPEENGQQIRAFLERHPEWSAGPSHLHLPLPDPEAPERPAPVDGGFAALLHRS